jgi:hypothetical protein
MKLFLSFGVCAIALCIVVATTSLVGQSPSRKTFSAPTYYIAARVNDCEPDPNYVAFRGASNLPPGALISAIVTGFEFDAWKDYSDEVVVPVNEQGFFAGEIQPKQGLRLGRNLILRVNFETYRTKQPTSVLEVVGKKGERLGGVENVPIIDIMGHSQNPQLFQVSGWYYGLETIARVPHCGEK